MEPQCFYCNHVTKFRCRNESEARLCKNSEESHKKFKSDDIHARFIESLETELESLEFDLADYQKSSDPYVITIMIKILKRIINAAKRAQ